MITFCCAFALKVREQEKEFARQMRNNVRLKKEEERKILEQHIKVLSISHITTCYCTPLLHNCVLNSELR